MASKKTLRRFYRERQKHYLETEMHEIEKREARLKGFVKATPADMAKAVLGIAPGQTHAEVAAEGIASNMNRAERRARGKR